MDDIYSKLAEILEVERVNTADVLSEFEYWDSLTVLSILAMLDSEYGINLTAAEIVGQVLVARHVVDRQRPPGRDDHVAGRLLERDRQARAVRHADDAAERELLGAGERHEGDGGAQRTAGHLGPAP